MTAFASAFRLAQVFGLYCALYAVSPVAVTPEMQKQYRQHMKLVRFPLVLQRLRWRTVLDVRGDLVVRPLRGLQAHDARDGPWPRLAAFRPAASEQADTELPAREHAMARLRDAQYDVYGAKEWFWYFKPDVKARVRKLQACIARIRAEAFAARPSPLFRCEPPPTLTNRDWPFFCSRPSSTRGSKSSRRSTAGSTSTSATRRAPWGSGPSTA